MDTTLTQDRLQDLLVKLIEWTGIYGLRLIAAFVIFFVGRWFAGKLVAGLRRVLAARQADPIVAAFLANLAYYGLIAVVLLAAISNLGIETTSLVAVIGAAGLAVGLALQGSLSNFAAGVLIILFRPFHKGDYIEAAGTGGMVEEISILFTILRSPDNKKVILPNSTVMNGNIINFSAFPTRRLDLTVGVSYADDVERVRAELEALLAADSRVLPDPAPVVALHSFGDSSVNFVVRPWVKTSEYWTLHWDLHAAIKRRFDAVGITIPFPQRDVHLFHHQSAPQGAPSSLVPPSRPQSPARHVGSHEEGA